MQRSEAAAGAREPLEERSDPLSAADTSGDLEKRPCAKRRRTVRSWRHRGGDRGGSRVGEEGGGGGGTWRNPVGSPERVRGEVRRPGRLFWRDGAESAAEMLRYAALPELTADINPL